jgi:hypothetical protein
MEIPKSMELEEKVFAINNEKQFEEIALEIYRFQYFTNSIYNRYCNALNKRPVNVHRIVEIPFLPISFFKSNEVKSTDFQPELVFKSSGTTGITTSRHFVKDPELYKRSFFTCFDRFFGPIEQYCILGLLPSYLEQGNSSLVYMVDNLVQKSNHPESGFYLYEFDKLAAALQKLEQEDQKTILFGVTYALLDYAKQYPMHLKNTVIIETGGMKGRKKEMIRSELYDILQKSFGLYQIHSEYGMTELFSQAYSVNGLYSCPTWMRVLLRDETDPLEILKPNSKGSSGIINVIDLANIYSCCFIATEDVGKVYLDGKFEVMGRMDNSDIRGCSLLV